MRDRGHSAPTTAAFCTVSVRSAVLHHPTLPGCASTTLRNAASSVRDGTRRATHLVRQIAPRGSACCPEEAAQQRLGGSSVENGYYPTFLILAQSFDTVTAIHGISRNRTVTAARAVGQITATELDRN